MILYLLHRAAKAFEKATSIEVPAGVVDQLEKLAETAMRYADEQFHKFMRSLIEEGPRTGEEKKRVAVEAMKELAPAGLTFTDKQAEIAVEAAVQKARTQSLRPPMPLTASIPPPYGMSSSRPPAPMPDKESVP